MDDLESGGTPHLWNPPYSDLPRNAGQRDGFGDGVPRASKGHRDGGWSSKRIQRATIKSVFFFDGYQIDLTATVKPMSKFGTAKWAFYQYGLYQCWFGQSHTGWLPGSAQWWHPLHFPVRQATTIMNMAIKVEDQKWIIIIVYHIGSYHVVNYIS